MTTPPSPSLRPAPAAPLPSFADTLRAHGTHALRREAVRTVQVNVGKLCNQACHHCHVDAGPTRTERLGEREATRILELLAASRAVEVLDITGGAPELNAEFPRLVAGARALGHRVLVRCNLTVLYEKGMEHLPDLYRDHEVELVCSLPCYSAANVDAQRGRGVFDRSIEALRLLNGLGYGLEGSPRRLDLVYNPLGAFLPPPQAELEAKYREELNRLFGIRFHHLLTLTNLPVRRFADMLARRGEMERYMGLLVAHFNASTVEGLMCRSMVSVAYDGALHDCDFHQMEEIPLSVGAAAQTIWSVGSFDELAGTGIATAPHCHGCTAGAGSSCGGSLA